MNSVTDCFEYMTERHLEDCFHDEDIDDEVLEFKRGVDDVSFCVGEKENLSLATKTIKILARIRNK